jgi:hypothetical protein
MAALAYGQERWDRSSYSVPKIVRELVNKSVSITKVKRLEPADARGSRPEVRPAQVACGENHTLFLSNVGQVWAWYVRIEAECSRTVFASDPARLRQR